MKSILKYFIVLSFILSNAAAAQNIGVGVESPVEKLEVAGNVKADSLKLSNAASQYDFLMKGDANGTVGFKKAHGAVGMNYIICTSGVFPSANRMMGEASVMAEVSVMGHVRIIASNTIPRGWAICNGLLLPVNQNQALFALLGYTYGGSGSQFALPDMRGFVPVMQGTNPQTGYSWNRAQKSD